MEDSFTPSENTLTRQDNIYSRSAELSEFLIESEARSAEALEVNTVYRV